MIRTLTCVLMFVAAAALLWTPAYAVDPAKKSSSLDDELLKGLGDDDPLVAPKKKAPAKPAHSEDQSPSTTAPDDSKPPRPKAPSKTDALDDELLKGLDEGTAKPESPPSSEDGQSGNALVDLNRRMRDVQRRMLTNNADDETVALQREILRKLDELIKQAEQQQQQSSSAKSTSKQRSSGTAGREQQQPSPAAQPAPKPSERPARDSADKLAKRKPQQPDMAQMRELLKDIWGELPPRLRQQMMQSSVEKFVPKYELLIEEYFKTLADEQNSAERR